MAYFPNATAWEYWATDNCFKCAHWPKTDDDAACPVEMAHMLYSYELCNEDDHTGKIILDMLIPQEGIETKQCGMFLLSEAAEADEAERRRLATQPAKYSAALAEMWSAAA